jgi:hypothetical protein
MRVLNGFCIALLFAGGLFAQYRGSATPYITGGFPSVVHPGGTAATSPGIMRFQTNVVHPGGGGPQLRVPYSNGYGNGYGRGNGYGYGYRYGRSNGNAGGYVYAYPYPVYVGGGYYDPAAAGYAGYVDPSAAAAEQQPVPPSPPASPIIINVGVPGPAAPPPPPAAQAPPEQSAQPQEDNGPEPTHYLIALKDHTIYAALAYWVEGNTLHYFTSGNVHNQVSLALVDRDLTERLNHETGVQINLPR